MVEKGRLQDRRKTICSGGQIIRNDILIALRFERLNDFSYPLPLVKRRILSNFFKKCEDGRM